MSRGGVLLVVALTLALSPAAAAGQSASQPDLVIVGRNGNTLTGDNIYNSDGVGQQREVIVDRRTVLVIRVQNDGTDRDIFTISASPPSQGFRVRYLSGRHDVTKPVTAGDTANFFAPVVATGEFAQLRVVIKVIPAAKLGAHLSLTIRATSGATDAVHIEATKTSTST
ncbi:MAG: hypothetical protein EXQ79_02570 [Acidimicrobiia bacterium]|nr:hypothetical protein [Acidimicrobiia bacterium]